MNTIPKEQLIDGALYFADQLKDAAVPYGDGVVWESLVFVEKGRFDSDYLEMLYSGSAGLCLFLDELARVSGRDDLRRLADDGYAAMLQRLREKSTLTVAGLTGDLSCVWPLLRRASLNPSGPELGHAQEIGRRCIEFIAPDTPIDDYINGRAGTAYTLMHLYHYTGDRIFLDTALDLTRTLIKNALVYDQGIAWEKSERQVRSLAGFSHGAGGVGYVFGEFARYLQLPGLRWVMERAFDYEDGFYHQEHGWPDFRVGVWVQMKLETALEAYRAGDMAYFDKSSYMSAWCHGAPGIGMGRLVSLQNYPGDARLERTVRDAVKLASRRGHPHAGFCQCHGIGGNMDLPIQAALDLNDPSLLEMPYEMAAYALQRIEDKGSFMSGYGENTEKDLSLFMGDTGVGYFLLRLAAPDQVFNILSPRLPEPPAPVTVDAPDLADPYAVRRQVYGNAYDRTLHLLESRYGDAFHDVSQDTPLDASIIDYMAALSKLGEKDADVLAVHDLEQRIDRAGQDGHGGVLATAQHDAEAVLKGLTLEDLPTLTVALHPGVNLHALQYYWPDAASQPEPVTKLDEPLSLMLFNRAESFVEEPIDDFISFLLEAVRNEANGLTLGKLVEQAVHAVGPEDDAQKEQAEALVWSQVKELLGAQVLVPKHL